MALFQSAGRQHTKEDVHDLKVALQGSITN
jgi:hypothetical protein